MFDCWPPQNQVTQVEMGECVYKAVVLAAFLCFAPLPASAVCIFGMGGDCPLTAGEAEKALRAAIDGKVVDQRRLTFLRVLRTRDDFGGTLVEYEFEVSGIGKREGYAGFQKYSDGWRMTTLCLRSMC